MLPESVENMKVAGPVEPIAKPLVGLNTCPVGPLGPVGAPDMLTIKACGTPEALYNVALPVT